MTANPGHLVDFRDVAKRDRALLNPHIAACETSFPGVLYEQAKITRAIAEHLDGADELSLRKLRVIHANTGIATRHFALPLSDYRHFGTVAQRNAKFREVGEQHASNAIAAALARAKIEPTEVDFIVMVTTTGMTSPSLDVLVAKKLGFRPDVKRVPVVGLGCVGGAAGLARLRDLLAGDPDAVGVLVAVELCSLGAWPADASSPELVASGIFGDGAVAVVATGYRRRPADSGSASIISTRSHLLAEAGNVVGVDIADAGFKVVLSSDIPAVVESVAGDVIGSFLADNNLTVHEVDRWICHPGGPRVLDALERALGLSSSAFETSRASLAARGNMSAASVLDVLYRDLAAAQKGEIGVMVGMGPGFCLELVLLRW